MTDCSINLVRGLKQNTTCQPMVVIKCLFQTFVPFTIKYVTVWSFKCFKDLFVEESYKGLKQHTQIIGKNHQVHLKIMEYNLDFYSILKVGQFYQF